MGYWGALDKFNRDTSSLILGTVLTDITPGGGGAINLQNIFNKTFTVYNMGGAPLVAGVVMVSPDNGVGIGSLNSWATLIGIAGGTLGSNTVWNTQLINDTYKWFRLAAAVASGSTATLNVMFRC